MGVCTVAGFVSEFIGAALATPVEVSLCPLHKPLWTYTRGGITVLASVRSGQLVPEGQCIPSG